MSIQLWYEAIERHPDHLQKSFLTSCSHHPVYATSLTSIFSYSPYLSRLMLKQLSWVALIQEKGLDQAFEDLLKELPLQLETLDSKEAVMASLRIAKQKAALLIALADISEEWPLEKVTRSLSLFAEVTVQETLLYLMRAAHKAGEIQLPSPLEAFTVPGIFVLAMGKLGAYELNYSSDIDLIVFYDAARLSYTGSQTLSQMVLRIVRDLVYILQERTKDGYVFRVDLRLRPDPASTPVALSSLAAETYYETVGQNWERAALIKARLIAGDKIAGGSFLHQVVRPFVWRKYLDFASIEDIQSIKRQIDSKQLHIPDNLQGYNIKIGHGGIREIEFFVQTQQLIWGGRDPNMRLKSTCETLSYMVEAGLLEAEVSANLQENYRYFRVLEHRLQMVDDQQTHTLPTTLEGLELVANFMGASSIESFIKDLRQRLSQVRNYYRDLFESSSSLATETGSLSFTGTDNDPETIATITSMGFSDGAMISERIRGWHHGRYRAMRTKRARELLTELTPAILSAFANTLNPDQAFIKFDDFLAGLPSGLQLFALFNANPHLLELVAEIMGSYPYLAEHLSRKPVLLDYVLTGNFFDPISTKETLLKELEQQLKEAQHFEEILDWTRIWAHEKQFQVGVQLIRGVITPRQVRHSLSDIAEAVLILLFRETAREFSKKHGTIAQAEFALIAMGKLGSRELTFNSDIDLILVYDIPEGESSSDGNEPLSASTYYNRLGRRFINSFTVLTKEGKLYNADMRLRPSGNDGPVSTAFATMHTYFGQAAQIWEYMALTKARVVAASPVMEAKIYQLLKEKLCTVWPENLGASIHHIRERIASVHGTTDPWRLKYVRGGLIDAEFIAQWLQLKYAETYPQLLHQNSLEVFRACQELGVLPVTLVQTLYESLMFLYDIQTILRLAAYRHKLTDRVKQVLCVARQETHFETIEAQLLATEAFIKETFYALTMVE